MLALAFATTEEMRAALAAVASPAELPDPAQGAWSPVALPDREVLVLVTGLSVVNAGLNLGRLLGAERVTGVCNLGIAGGFDPALGPGAVVVADAECWPEYGVLEDSFPDPEALGRPLLEDARGEVVNRLDLDPDAAARAMGLRLDPAWARGAGLTVSAVTATAARAQALRERHGALTESMEGFALALGCRRAGLPFLEVRALSNPVGPRQGTWDVQGALVGLGRAARTLLGLGGGSP